MKKTAIMMLVMFVCISLVSCSSIGKEGREIKSKIEDVIKDNKDFNIRVSISRTTYTLAQGFILEDNSSYTISYDIESEVTKVEFNENFTILDEVNKNYEEYVFDFFIPKESVEKVEDEDYYMLNINRQEFKSKYVDWYNLLGLKHISDNYQELRLTYFEPESDKYVWRVQPIRSNDDIYTYLSYIKVIATITVEFYEE